MNIDLTEPRFHDENAARQWFEESAGRMVFRASIAEASGSRGWAGVIIARACFTVLIAAGNSRSGPGTS